MTPSLSVESSRFTNIRRGLFHFFLLEFAKNSVYGNFQDGSNYLFFIAPIEFIQNFRKLQKKILIENLKPRDNYSEKVFLSYRKMIC